MHYLYKITDAANNKVYIGQSNKETERWRQHKYFARQDEPVQYIHRAMKKYGIENFIYEVIAQCLTQEDADETEIKLIKQYDSQNKEHGYNVARGGDHAWNAGLPSELQPMYGKHQSDYQKQRMSEVHKGSAKPLHTDEWKQNMSEVMSGRISPMLGKKQSEYQKQRVSEANVGNKHRLGTILTEDHKQKISLSLSGENSPLAKLTWDKVNSIRAEFAAGISRSILTQKYDVSRDTINRILRNNIWKI